MDFTYIFGPVPSGRLGRSLGLDLLGKPICDFDCLYCEVGRTRIHTTERKPWVQAETLLTELENWLALDLPRPDYITLGGKGEPCLNSDLGKIIQGVHALAPDIPVAVLTNATLLGDPGVQEELQGAQVVLPSMDTLVEEEFLRLNKPCAGLDLGTLSQGILDWARTFPGKIFLEILLVQGINDTEENLKRLTAFCASLKPHRIDVVTMSRPGAYAAAHPVSPRVRARWEQTLGAGTSRIRPADLTLPDTPVHMDSSRRMQAISHSIAIRPQTPGQIALAMGLPRKEVEETLHSLYRGGQVVRIVQDDGVYYTLAGQDREESANKIS